MSDEGKLKTNAEESYEQRDTTTRAFLRRFLKSLQTSITASKQNQMLRRYL